MEAVVASWSAWSRVYRGQINSGTDRAVFNGAVAAVERGIDA